MPHIFTYPMDLASISSLNTTKQGRYVYWEMGGWLDQDYF